MDHIDAHLATLSQDLKFSPAIRASLALGKTHMNKYYNMTYHSEVYRIVMSKFSFLSNHLSHLRFYWTVLHPRHKLQYFRNANWSEEWIATATSIVREEFERAYADLMIDEVVVTTENVCLPSIFKTHDMIAFSAYQVRQAEYIRWPPVALSSCPLQAQRWARTVPCMSGWECQKSVGVVDQEPSGLPSSLSDGIRLPINPRYVFY